MQTQAPIPAFAKHGHGAVALPPDAPVGPAPYGVCHAEWAWRQLVYENAHGLANGSLARARE